MKLSLLILLLVWLPLVLAASVPERGNLRPPMGEYDFEALNQTLFSDRKLEKDQLKKVKYYLINGETRLARVYLRKIANSRTALRPIISRYLGMLDFIEGNYQEAYQEFSAPELQNIPHYSKICTVKTLTRIILSKTRGLEEEWYKCQEQNITNLNPQSRLWISTLVSLKTTPKKGSTRVPFEKEKLSRYENEDLKILLKLALYLNQEEIIAPQLTDLTLDQLRDEEIRELIGAIYFRLGTFSKAYKFVEGLVSPNSENIKGNLYVLRDKYELAYAQFKLALEQKQNSQNAMERLLPLAWILGDWQNGAIYAERVLASPQTQINKLTLLAAFLTQKGDFKEAKRVLNSINQKSMKGTRLEVTQINSFVSLMQNDQESLVKQAGRSCAQNDLVNCWILYQTTQWENFPLTARRDDEVINQELAQKLTTEELDRPLKETVYINQIDIEEMDDKLIRLLPKTP